jgi:3-hydroxyisobutyrate dehydrogenase-like beta-hydroxyacid dehydrogenase
MPLRPDDGSSGEQAEAGARHVLVGFVGLGEMGSLMAARLAGWPGGSIVYDIRPEAARRLADEGGARVAGSVADLAAEADIVSVMVVDDAQVRAVAEEIFAAARPGTILAVHSTIRAATAEDLARRGAGREIAVLDVPVSGGVIGARSGRLALLAGGDRAAYERCKEPFGCYADLIVHFGPAGAGTRAKLARNLVNFVAIAGALEGARLAGEAGIDVAKLSRVTTHSDSLSGGPGAVMLRGERGPLAADDPLLPVFAHTWELGAKDLGLVIEMGADLGLALPLAGVAREHLAEYLGVAPGGGRTASGGGQ